MDALERLSSVGLDLLGRVDAALMSSGAPADHPIWALLRRTGALPGDALDFAVRLEAEPLRAASAELRTHADRFARQHELLGADVGTQAWRGSGAAAFGAVWDSLVEHIGDGTGTDPNTVTGRLIATASYVDGLVDWIGELRSVLVEVMLRVLTSAEAVTVRADGPAKVDAAARIGALVLEPVAAALDAAHDLREAWAARLTELPYRPPVEVPVGGGSRSIRAEL